MSARFNAPALRGRGWWSAPTPPEIRQHLPTGAVEVLNPDWRQGMLSSLQAGIRDLIAAESPADTFIESGLESAVESASEPVEPGVLSGRRWDGLCMALVDVPRLSRRTVEALLAMRAGTRAAVVLPTYEGRRGHPVLFGRELWVALLEARAEEGPRAVVRAYSEELAEVTVDDPWILRDADTPDEHRRLTGD